MNLISKLALCLCWLAINSLEVLSSDITVMIWHPDGDRNPYGHAAIQTKNYHMSLWPDGDVKRDFGRWDTLINGAPASLNFHHQYDYELEGKREPKIYDINYVDLKKIEESYEEMLSYNNITPDKVVLETGNKKVKELKKPEISLSRSLYSFMGVGQQMTEDSLIIQPISCSGLTL